MQQLMSSSSNWQRTAIFSLAMASAGGVDDDGERDVVLKILVIGDHDVGKTSIIKR